MSVRIALSLFCVATVASSVPVSSQTQLPFMAQYKTTQVRTLPNGSTITDETTEVIAVDSHGRRMTATAKTPSPGDEPRTRFSIYDPVAHIKFSYLSPGTEATVSALPLGVDYPCAHGAAGMDGPTKNPADEDLGIATFHGVEARGSRSSKTVILPHDQKPTLLNTVEVWTAVDSGLGGLLVRYVNDNRRTGTSTTEELVSFRESKPPPFMFRVPKSYRIISREVSTPGCPEILGDPPEPLPPPAH